MRCQWIVLVVAIVLQNEPCTVHSYPHGAPVEACGNMTPGHGYTPQDPAINPFVLELSVTTIEGGQELTVNLGKADPLGPSFEGFLIRASPVDQTDTESIGQFTTIDHGLVQYSACFNNGQSAITHVSPVLKDYVTAVWRAPYYNGTVVFLASVVYNFTTYFVKFQSPQVAVSYVGPFVPTSTTPAPVATFDYSICGVSQSCYGYPTGCVTAQDCMMIVSYYAVGTDLHANIVGNTPGYVAFGLSTDNTMGEDSILECMATATLKASVNKGHDNYLAGSDPSYFTLESAIYSGGNVNCVVSRPAQTTVVAQQAGIGSVTTDLTANNYYLLISLGYLTDDGSTIIVHEFRQPSTTAVNVLSATPVIVS